MMIKKVYYCFAQKLNILLFLIIGELSWGKHGRGVECLSK